MRSTGSPSWIERLTGLGPRALPPFAFGLARRELRFAAFAPTPHGEGGRTLLELSSATLAESLFAPAALAGPATDGDALEGALKSLLARLARPPKEAALVLPDAWARGLMIDGADFPDDTAARREVLRFRLKRLVPFRVEELRVEAMEIQGGAPDAAATNGNAGSERAGSRAFVTLANDPLCAQLEETFARCGIRVGWISGATAATLAGIAARGVGDGADGADRVFGLARVESEGFTLVLAAAGEPLVWRQKTFTEGLADGDRERLLTAELRLTRSFLAERGGGRPLEVLYLAAPRAVEPFWSRVLEDGLGVSPGRLRPEHVGLEADLAGEAYLDLLPLAGAVAREVR